MPYLLIFLSVKSFPIFPSEKCHMPFVNKATCKRSCKGIFFLKTMNIFDRHRQEIGKNDSMARICDSGLDKIKRSEE